MSSSAKSPISPHVIMRDRHTNPCELIERYPEHNRERFLSGKELQQLGSVLAKAEAEQTESQYAVAPFAFFF
jgi:hypothetical protein